MHEPHPGVSSVLVMRIPITDNPTALLAPPEVNMSRTRGSVVLRDLPGYEPANGRYEFTDDDLLARLGAVTEERIAACTASPVKEKSAPGADVRRLPSPVSMRAVRRCLDEVRQYAEWAQRHHYRQLAAARAKTATLEWFARWLKP